MSRSVAIITHHYHIFKSAVVKSEKGKEKGKGKKKEVVK